MDRGVAGSAVERVPLPRRVRRVLWAWVVVMLVFFSRLTGQAPRVLLVLRPALAILLAGWLAPQLARWRARPAPWPHRGR